MIKSANNTNISLMTIIQEGQATKRIPHFIMRDRVNQKMITVKSGRKRGNVKENVEVDLW